ncbi:hypothetical protein [Gymnodinialimonas ulvae]|uniref:hypothetical protein n=1 Tax=Gymnodinialimonas ulvae TaxID=3126504 RepID=UPI0030955052
MTALQEYRRLEAIGLWREHAEDQRREVIVALGDVSLVMSSPSGEAIGHWSLPAVERRNPGKRPALYAPAPDSEEELELSDPEMIAAIERICAAIARTRPHPGRLRLYLAGGAILVGVLAAALWLPDAMIRQTVSLLPPAKRLDIGHQLLAEISNIAGRPCGASSGRTALVRLASRTYGPDNPPRIVVFPATIPDTLTLPGDIVVASAALAEDYETPEVFAGYLLAERTRSEATDPVEALLRHAGIGATFRLLTTGDIAAEPIHAHAATLLSHDTMRADESVLLDHFAEVGISSQPYAFAQDVSGESVLGLIEADPLRGQTTEPVLTDGDWVSLQEICTS